MEKKYFHLYRPHTICINISARLKSHYNFHLASVVAKERLICQPRVNACPCGKFPCALIFCGFGAARLTLRSLRIYCPMPKCAVSTQSISEFSSDGVCGFDCDARRRTIWSRYFAFQWLSDFLEPVCTYARGKQAVSLCHSIQRFGIIRIKGIGDGSLEFGVCAVAPKIYIGLVCAPHSAARIYAFIHKRKQPRMCAATVRRAAIEMNATLAQLMACIRAKWNIIFRMK